jgi:hypothetical protein
VLLNGILGSGARIESRILLLYGDIVSCIYKFHL